MGEEHLDKVRERNDQKHSLVLVFGSAAMVVFCVYLLVCVIFLKQADAAHLLPWFFIGFAVIEAYGAHFLREPHRWAWALTMLLAGVALVVRDVWHVKADWLFSVWIVLALIALVCQIGYVKNRLMKSGDKKPSI